jgi:hypothetical protein
MSTSAPLTVPPAVASPGYGEYEIDIEEILRQGLPAFFASVPRAPLTAATVNAIPARAKGAYMLLLDGHPVYAGKTDTRHGFRDRLGRHAFTVQHRRGLDPARLTFKAVRILVFSSFDVEAILIQETRRADPTALRWNFSGFGSNDPGRNRDAQEPAEFDIEFPVDIDRPLPDMATGEMSAGDALRRAKAILPYLLRFGGHAELDGTMVSIPDGATLRMILTTVLGRLPQGWQATVFPGRVIMYREDRHYPHATETLGGGT